MEYTQSFLNSPAYLYEVRWMKKFSSLLLGGIFVISGLTIASMIYVTKSLDLPEYTTHKINTELGCFYRHGREVCPKISRF